DRETGQPYLKFPRAPQRKWTCAAHPLMSALGQKRTYGIAAIQQVSRRTLRLFRCGQSINFLLEFLHIVTRALQHRAVETGERGGGNGLLYLRIGRTSSFCQFSVTVNAVHARNLCCHTEGNELLGFRVQSSFGIPHG